MTNVAPEVIEYLKCKKNPLYFIEKYVKIPTQGGPKLISEAGLWHKTNKYRLAIKCTWKFHKLILLFPRQTGKTTFLTSMDLHTLNFYEGIQAGFISLDKGRVTDYIRRLQYIYDQLPVFLKAPQKRSLSDRVTYFKLENKSQLHTSSVSGNIDPGNVMRGLSLSTIFIDEAAFLPLDQLLTAVGPAYSKASIEAKDAGKPYSFILTTTPNGINDGGFYNLMINATPVNELLVNPEDPLCDELLPDDQCKEILEQPGRNGYVFIKLNWNEVYDDAWYEEQRRTLNFNKRRISQEVDLVFLGSSTSIFSDDIIMKIQPAKKVWNKNLFNNYNIHFLTETFDPDHVYVIGVDVAASSEDSVNADYSSIVLWDATDDIQVAEMKARIPVLKYFSYSIKELVRFLIEVVNIPEENLILGIERNSFGLGVIENLIYDEDLGDLFERILYKTEIRSELVHGVQVTAANRPLIVNTLVQKVNENPNIIKGEMLANELRGLEQKSNGRIEAARGLHDDVFFAAAHAVNIRKELIKQGRLEGKNENYGIKINLDNILNNVLVHEGPRREKQQDLLDIHDLPDNKVPKPEDYISMVF